jgi:hypothetical protein
LLILDIDGMKSEEAEKLMRCDNSLRNPKEKKVTYKQIKYFFIFIVLTLIVYLVSLFILENFVLKWEIRQCIYFINIILLAIGTPFSLKYAIYFWKAYKKTKKYDENNNK